MTAENIAEMALVNLGQTLDDSGDLIQLTPGFLNVILAEALPVENSIRKHSGQAELSTAPYLTAADMGGDINYSDKLCRIALVYGLTACYYANDDNDYRAADYRARYINALNEAETAEYTTVKDVYADEGDV